MIGYIKGTIEGIFSDSVLLENHGMGYHIYTSQMVLNRIGAIHQEVLMYTYLHVREDDLSLFGFLTNDELDTFKLLLTVNGVGPKVALSILSVLSVRDLAVAVMANDTKAITKANGIGAKGANRIIMELKDKLTLDDVFGMEDNVSVENALANTSVTASSVQDTILALVQLGYSESEALKAIGQIPDSEGIPPETLLKAALKKLF